MIEEVCFIKTIGCAHTQLGHSVEVTFVAAGLLQQVSIQPVDDITHSLYISCCIRISVRGGPERSRERLSRLRNY